MTASSTGTSISDYPTCSTCSHWGETSAYDHSGSGRFRVCGAVPMQKEVTEEVQARSLALAVDAEWYWAELITAADFGCVLHEPAPASAKENP